MRQAITTKYLAPTNNRGARIKASCRAGNTVHDWDHELNPEQNHEIAAASLVNQLGWNNQVSKIIGGEMKDGRCCFVLVPRE